MRGPAVKHRAPASSIVLYWIGWIFLKLGRWRIAGELPPVSRAVLIAAPHTSAWDFPFMIAVAWVFRLRLRYLGRHTLFEGPLAGLMRWLGGIPVDRRAPHGLVGQVAARFEREEMILAISPEGTRARKDHWRSGFYHIAREARVPIILGFLDFGRKVGGVGPSFIPTENVHADMERVRAFYGPITGKRPQLQCDIRLSEETRQASEDEPQRSASDL
jgi:1-acyl-sn-glycerol-3-phosphate acyltransferase